MRSVTIPLQTDSYYSPENKKANIFLQDICNYNSQLLHYIHFVISIFVMHKLVKPHHNYLPNEMSVSLFSSLIFPLKTRAGTPATIDSAGTSLVTTEPAPITESEPT